jgi:hypothetical protein
MTTEVKSLTNPSIKSPRAAAIAGILFAVLFGICLVLIRISFQANVVGSTLDLKNSMKLLSIATNLVPYAGIAFLWFIGVVRDHLGSREDQFFSTVFLGSGLLFLAMTFSAAAIVIGMITSYSIGAENFINSQLYVFSRSLISAIFNIFAIRMGGVLMVSLGTIWIRSKVMPLWLAILTYVAAFTLLLSVSLNLWITLIFPAWVFLISAYILLMNLQTSKASNLEGMQGKIV